SNQQRQIDQLCSFVFEQARSQGALEEIGLHPNLKYDLIFADFSRGTALLNAKSLGYKNYGKGYPVIIGDVRSEVLQDWCNNPNNVQ
ncbi:MAG: hypothetical protein NTW46_03265, partial [Candidatus Nealsonbacteria bacterium]|nr:hypothetical protein [Candidatus Nealsonbacteria bacterium]